MDAVLKISASTQLVHGRDTSYASVLILAVIETMISTAASSPSQVSPHHTPIMSAIQASPPVSPGTVYSSGVLSPVVLAVLRAGYVMSEADHLGSAPQGNPCIARGLRHE
jgi:hypothetical protein